MLLAVPGYGQIDGIDNARAFSWPQTKLTYGRMIRMCAVSRSCGLRKGQKRFLAAAIAVGTIDQALLSIVQTAHAHLRSACLNRSLLVVDEVHASDHYMSQLLSALLERHWQVGGYALLLSATLGSSARQAFLQHNSEIPYVSLHEAISAPYPAVTLADGTSIAAKPRPEQRKTVFFHTMPYAFQLPQLIQEILQALHRGARVLVVLNTVARC